MFLVYLALMMVTFNADDPNIVEARYRWSAPTTGTPVVHYVTQHRYDGGEWVTVSTTPDTTDTVDILYKETSFVRVAGVDAEDRQGPYSDSSDPYNPYAHRPEKSSKPVRR